MDFNLKNYQIFKLKKYFKKNDFFFLFHSAKSNSVKWTSVEQNFKKSKLSYYKPLNGTTIKTLKNSIYRNFNALVNGLVLFINANYKTTILDYNSTLKNFKSSFSLISVKLNNKIYSPVQLRGMKKLSYKQNAFILHKTLLKHLKTSYVLTKNKP